MDEGDVKCKEYNNRSRRLLHKRMCVTLSKLQAIGVSLINCKK